MAALTLFVLILAACGGNTRQGVELQPVDVPGQARAYQTPTPTPDTSSALGLSGRLLYLKGKHVEIHDLASGDTQVIADMQSRSPVIVTPDATRAAFIAFPDLGLIDLTTGEVRTVHSAASNPISYGISPDGQWVVVLNGTFTMRLIVIRFDDQSVVTVAGKSNTFFNWAWTTDSHLVWWEASDDPQWMLFNGSTQESTPVDLADVQIEVPAPAQRSPDGQLVARVPVAFNPFRGQSDLDTCFDSYVELYDATATASILTQSGRSVWTEAGLVAASPQWLTSDLLLFVKIGSGQCETGPSGGSVFTLLSAERQVMLLDVTATDPQPRVLAGPLGNADDTNDRAQQAQEYGHLYSPSPDGRYVAWISGGFDGGVSAINVTEVITGTTQTILSVAIADTRDAADYLENHLIRQVIWLK
jgi:hypothetical protein